MKSICYMLLTFIIVLSGSESTVAACSFARLYALNAHWLCQNIGDTLLLPSPESTTEASWIRLHLSLVEKVLRGRSTSTLSQPQAAARARSLENLHRYWLTGIFPKNESVPGRSPVFIDRSGNFCAVGYLLKASGNEPLARHIVATANLAYLPEICEPALDAWAASQGFTKDELAWIQPTYGYPYGDALRPVGGGTNGSVYNLCPDSVAGRLYVGGAFSMVDSAVPAHNIAFVTKIDSGIFAWHALDSGVNGPVHAIALHTDTVFIGGHFSMAGADAVNNVAWWDGAKWHAAGCLDGTVHALLSFNGIMYAAGAFGACGTSSNTAFARWTGHDWQMLPAVQGNINTLAACDTFLLLGGSFSFGGKPCNVLRYYPLSRRFVPFANGIANEVKDIAIFQDSAYAACINTVTWDSGLAMVMRDNRWEPNGKEYYLPHVGPEPVSSFNCLCVAGRELYAAGYFHFNRINVEEYNCTNLYPAINHSGAPYFATDTAVRTMAMFGGELIAGGDFNGDGRGSSKGLHSIGRRVFHERVWPFDLAGIQSQQAFIIAPNPAPGAGLITLRNCPANAVIFRLYDIVGRIVLNDHVTDSRSLVALPRLQPGVYQAQITDNAGAKISTILLVQ